MRKSDHSKNTPLMRRIEQNYEDFKRETVKLSGESIFELAPKIAAVHDAYFYMTTHDWADGYEKEYLMGFDNPLEYLADEWQERSEDRGRDFGKMLTELTENGCEYMAYSTADALREKYGGEMPLNTAALLEMVELGKKIITRKSLYDMDFDFEDYDGDDMEDDY